MLMGNNCSLCIHVFSFVNHTTTFLQVSPKAINLSPKSAMQGSLNPMSFLKPDFSKELILLIFSSYLFRNNVHHYQRPCLLIVTLSFLVLLVDSEFYTRNYSNILTSLVGKHYPVKELEGNYITANITRVNERTQI